MKYLLVTLGCFICLHAKGQTAQANYDACLSRASEQQDAATKELQERNKDAGGGAVLGCNDCPPSQYDIELGQISRNYEIQSKLCLLDYNTALAAEEKRQQAEQEENDRKEQQRQAAAQKESNVDPKKDKGKNDCWNKCVEMWEKTTERIRCLAFKGNIFGSDKEVNTFYYLLDLQNAKFDELRLSNCAGYYSQIEIRDLQKKIRDEKAEAQKYQNKL